MSDIKNVVIIGSGPAGLTCAIYTSRAWLSPVVIAGEIPGGQLITTDSIENFPGFNSISGADLMMKIMGQAEAVGTTILFDKVSDIKKNTNQVFELSLSSGNRILAKSVVIATGAAHKHLLVKGEEEFTNKGVSWCATCDGPMFKNKRVAVVGGGNTALMEALFLSNFSQEVFLIHRRDSFRADKVMQDRVLNNPKIKIIWNSTVTEICGSDHLSHIFLNNFEKLEIEGLFIAIGTFPSSDFAKNILELDEDNYIKTTGTKTSCPGIFAAGDVVSGSLKQAVFAAGQGALAATKVEQYLESLK